MVELEQIITLDVLFSPDTAAPAYSILVEDAADFVAGLKVHATHNVNIDSDGQADLLVLAVEPATQQLSLRIQVYENGSSIGSLDSFVYIAVESNWIDAEIATGDMEGDGREEIAVTATYQVSGGTPVPWLYVFDDATAGFAPLFSEVGNAHAREQRVAMGDLDGDGDAELIVLTTDAAYNYSLVTLRAYDMGSAGFELHTTFAPPRSEFEPLIPQEGNHGLESSYGYTTLAVADFDADGSDEIVLITVDPGSGSSFYACYDGLEEDVSTPLGLILGRSNFTSGGGGDVLRYGPLHYQMFVACDASRATGFELIAFYVNDDANTFQTGTLTHTSDILNVGEGTSHEYFNVEREGSEEYSNPTAMTACDDDGDGLDDIVLLTQPGNGGNSVLRVRRFEWLEEISPNTGIAEGEWERTHVTIYSAAGFDGAPILASGDADGDGIGLRFTGNSFLKVANPIPLVVLVAPPNKGGTTQSLASTGASYSFSHTTGVTHEVSYSTSYSSSLNGSVGSILSGNYGRAAESEYTRAYGSTRLLTEFEEYNGVASDDYIIFHGLLVQRYVYEVVRAEDPTLMGTEMVINVPVQAQQYFRTRDYYNERVVIEAQIGEDVLGQTIGDPTSYATHSKMESLVASGTDVVWWRSEGQSIPQGSGNSGHGFELGQESSTAG